MKFLIYNLLIYLFLILYLLFAIDSLEELLPFCIIFNIVNVFLLLNNKKNCSKHNLSKLVNIIINISTIMFMYPDLIAGDPYINIYGEQYYIIKAFKLILLHQSIITISLKVFELRNLGNVNLNNINFYNKKLLKIIININLLGILLYLFLGNNINNFFLGRSSRLVGSFFRIKGYTGGYSSLFYMLNYLVQFTAILGLIYLFNVLLTKLTQRSFKLRSDKISKTYKYLLLFLTIFFLVSSYLSDIRMNLIIVLIPTSLLFLNLGEYKEKFSKEYSLFTKNTSKFVLIFFLICSFLIISEIQVYRRGNINFFEKGAYNFSENNGIVQTDKALYNLSQIIKLTPRYGTEEGKIIIKNIPYNFVPSLISPNKPTKLTREKHEDVENSIFYNFNDLRTNSSISITYLGEFIYAFGEKRGFVYSIISLITLSYLIIFILIKTINYFLYPYIHITLMSFLFLICRSLNFYSTQFSLFIYSTLFLSFFIILVENFKGDTKRLFK